MKFVIVHGTTSRPERSWFPWLAWKLLRNGHDVYVPRLPTPKNQTYLNWKSAFEMQVPNLDSDIVLIGHSTGTTFLIRYLSELETKLKLSGLFLVSFFVQPLKIPNNPSFEPIVNSFTEGLMDWEKLKGLTTRRYVYHGSNDPFVPLAHGEYVSQKLQAQFLLIENGGHLNTEAGFCEFEPIYEELLRL